MKSLVATIILSAAAFVGCDSKPSHEAQEAERNFQQTVKSTTDDMQWKVDEATAQNLFDRDLDGVSEYMDFRQCHKERLNGKRCQMLMARVKRQEKRDASAAARHKHGLEAQ